MIEDVICARCDREFSVVDEPDQCIQCGEPLCVDCYEQSSYCNFCEADMKAIEADQEPIEPGDYRYYDIRRQPF